MTRKYFYYHQVGGGDCSLCGSPGATKTTCPCNPDAKNPNPAKHPLATKVCKAKVTKAKAKATKRAPAKVKLAATKTGRRRPGFVRPTKAELRLNKFGVPIPHPSIDCRLEHKCRTAMPHCCSNDTPAAGYCRKDKLACHATGVVGSGSAGRVRDLSPEELAAIRKEYLPK